MKLTQDDQFVHIENDSDDPTWPEARVGDIVDSLALSMTRSVKRSVGQAGLVSRVSDQQHKVVAGFDDGKVLCLRWRLECWVENPHGTPD